MGLKQKQDYVLWLREYDWTWFGTLTFRIGVWRKAANRLFGEWLAQLQVAEPEALSWFRMGEYSPKNHHYHFHFAIAGVQLTDVQRAIALWKLIAGLAQIGPYDPSRRGIEYALKSMEDTFDPDFDAELHDEHLRSAVCNGSLLSITTDLALTVEPRPRDRDDVTSPQRARGMSDRAVPAERPGCTVQEMTNVTEPSARPATLRRRRPLRRNIYSMTMYELWCAICRRCSSPKPPNYRNRDKRPTVCCRWKGRNGFGLFVRDMGERPSPFHRLRRIDRNAAFSPSNCVWVDPSAE
jgi:hypothetical protein